jgi:hypothetical protein
MAAIDELAGEAEVLENLAAVEEEAQALAATLKGLSAYAQSVKIEGVLADMNELTSILGEEGNNTIVNIVLKLLIVHAPFPIHPNGAQLFPLLLTSKPATFVEHVVQELEAKPLPFFCHHAQW